MIKDECKHEWQKHTNVRGDRMPGTYMCKKCNSEMTAGDVFQLEESRKQSERHKEILTNQNEYNRKQLWWSRTLAVATWALVVSTLLLVKLAQ